MKQERGSVTVEFALVLPFLVLLVVGGWVLGYLAYTKLALSMAANRAARDLAAATELYPALTRANRPYGYHGGFAESFGLPRWGIHALAMKVPVNRGTGEPPSNHAVVVAACYRVPFVVPFRVTEKAEPQKRYLPNTGQAEDLVLDVADLLEIEELRRQVAALQKAKQELEEEIGHWDRVFKKAGEAAEQGKRLWDKGKWIAELGTDLLGEPVPDLQEYGGAQPIDPTTLEAKVAELCQPPERFRGESVVMTSRAAYLMQEDYRRGSSDAASAAGR